MHMLAHFITYLFAPIAALTSGVSPRVASLISAPTISGAYVISAIMVASALVAFGSGLWVLIERARLRALKQSAQANRRQARAELILRDSVIANSPEAVVVLGTDTQEQLAFGAGAQFLDGCLSGLNARDVSSALTRLAQEGTAFLLTARHKDGRIFTVRGRPIGSAAVVFLQPGGSAISVEADFPVLLDSLPMPAWIRDNDLDLRWVNRAYLSATGIASIDEARKTGAVFDGSEQDLARVAKRKGAAEETVCDLVIGDSRRKFSVKLQPLANGCVVGTAHEIVKAAEPAARLPQEIDDRADTLDFLTSAVAIFDPDQHLTFYNRAFAQLWTLPEAWLHSQPRAGEFLDRLRDIRALPEQSDFAAWKKDQLKFFEAGTDRHFEELWYLPDGRNMRVRIQPRPFGNGVVFIFEDVSKQLLVQSSYNELIKVQRATLDALQEGIVVFGSDGKLKVHNLSFAQLWGCDEEGLRSLPHVTSLAEDCRSRFGRDDIWDIVASEVTSLTPQRHTDWGQVERSDGRIITLTLTRLPDGAALASFADVTDQTRLEAALRETPSAAIRFRDILAAPTRA